MTEQLTESGREWRDRALEAEGLIDTLGALKDAAELRAAEAEGRRDYIWHALDRMVLRWERTVGQRDELARLLAGRLEVSE